MRMGGWVGFCFLLMLLFVFYLLLYFLKQQSANYYCETPASVISKKDLKCFSALYKPNSKRIGKLSKALKTECNDWHIS